MASAFGFTILMCLPFFISELNFLYKISLVVLATCTASFAISFIFYASSIHILGPEEEFSTLKCNWCKNLCSELPKVIHGIEKVLETIKMKMTPAPKAKDDLSTQVASITTKQNILVKDRAKSKHSGIQYLEEEQLDKDFKSATAGKKTQLKPQEMAMDVDNSKELPS